MIFIHSVQIAECIFFKCHFIYALIYGIIKKMKKGD